MNNIKIDFSSTESPIHGFTQEKITNINKYNIQSVDTIIDYTFDQPMNRIEMIRLLEKYRRILRPVGSIIIKSIKYNIQQLADALIYADFIDLLQLDTNTIRASNQPYVIGKFETSSDKPKIFIESTARVFGDSLLAYPLTSLFKTKYPDCTIYYGCGKQEKYLFKLANTIDHVVNRYIDDPSVVSQDNKYDIIIRAPFDVDQKWHPENYFGDLDTPAGWEICRKQNPLKFNWKQEDIDKILSFIHTDKLKVGIFLSSPRKKSTLPYECFGYDRYQEIVDQLPNIQFYTFYGSQETPNQLQGDNVVNLGLLNAYKELILFEYLDLLVSISTSVSAMIAPIAALPQVVIHTCEEDGIPAWIAPDKCVLPPMRMRYLCGNNDNILYVKPKEDGKTYTWNFNNYWEKAVIPRKMRISHEIPPKTIVDAIVRMLAHSNTGCEFEYPICDSICDHCRLKHCLYKFTPIKISNSTNEE